MNHFGSKLALVLGLSTLLAGCADSVVDPGNAPLLPPSDNETPGGLAVILTGGGGQNGLKVSSFHGNRAEVGEAMSLPLLKNKVLNNDVVNIFKGRPGGPETLEYLLRCSAPPDVCSNYAGKKCSGLLASTAPWLGQGLSATAPARKDLWACVATHLNPYDAIVPIWLTGDDVLDQPTLEAKEYDFEEALWTGPLPSPSGGPTAPTGTINVWPLHDIENYCGEEITNASFNLRYCGKASCGPEFIIHENLGECTKNEKGNMTCLGERALKTWLKSTDVATLHPRCALNQPPPQ